jgi:hypothetical protein
MGFGFNWAYYLRYVTASVQLLTWRRGDQVQVNWNTPGETGTVLRIRGPRAYVRHHGIDHRPHEKDEWVHLDWLKRVR